MSGERDESMRSQVAWYAKPDPTGDTSTGETGLRFACTMCGNCCTGAPGYVLFTPDEEMAMAAELGVSDVQFAERYTRRTILGRSLTEVETPHGHDCVFLDRTTSPGKALCRVYNSRPSQCRTWPFWKENLGSVKAWRRAGQTCPGMGQGPLHEPKLIELRVAQDVGAGRADG